MISHRRRIIRNDLNNKNCFTGFEGLLFLVMKPAAFQK